MSCLGDASSWCLYIWATPRADFDFPVIDFDLDLVNALIRDGTQLKKQVEELEQQNKELKEQAEDLKKRIEELQKQIEELKLNSAQILAAGFEAAREQFACLFPDLDLSMVSLDNEVVDGKVVPAED